MNRTIAAIVLASTILTSLGTTEARTAETKTPQVQKSETPVKVAKAPSHCQQLGIKYQDLYTFEADEQLITICQKDQQYYYLRHPKQDK